MEFVTNNARRAYYCPEHAERAKVKRLRETRRAGKIELLTKDGV